MSETVLPAAAASTAPSPATTTLETMKLAVERLRDALPKVQEVNPAYGNSLSNFLQRIDDPVRLNQAEVQHRIAYAVRDVAQLTGSFGQFDDTSAKLISSLSISAPGLRNESVAKLLVEATSSSDGSLRNDIRRTAIEVGRQTDQATPQIESQVEVLENRVRLSQGSAVSQPPSQPVQGPAASTPASPGLDASGKPAGFIPAASAQQPVKQIHEPSVEATGAGTEQQRRQQQQVGQEGYNQAGAGAAIASSFLRGFQRLGDAIPPPPWEMMTTSFGDRLKSFEAGQQARSDQKVISGLEQSGANALSALQNLTNNEGATMMSRVNQAARSDPNGMEGVLAEMRPGGKYADLRQQFNIAINDEKGFAAAYDKAVEAVGQYAQDRKAASPIVARSNDAVAVTAKLEALEQNVGERMAAIPSLSDGKTMLEDLRKQAAEVFQAVAEGIKNLFQRVTSSASPSPSP